MTPKHFYLLLLAVIAAQTAVAQNEDELQIPVENDNQFPPDNHSDVIEGSGDGIIEEPIDITAEITQAPPIENIESRILPEDIGAAPSEDEDVCPKPCVCRIEGNTNDFVIDCSGYDLTEFPSPLSEKATVLNIQKNKITEIPKHISTLKNLRVLNANDNSIMNLASGSISELPELVTLKLGNNRLLEFPSDLKNSFGLTKLEELDLGGNDMRTDLTAEEFSKFESLQTITLPSANPELKQNLCDVLTRSLVKVCTGSCETESYNCQDEPGDAGDIPVIPGMIPPPLEEDDDGDFFNNNPQEAIDQNNDEQEISSDTTIKADVPNISDEVTPTSVFSFRSAVNKQASDVSPLNSLIDNSQDVSSTTESSVKVGATTIATKTGGVDKSIIGLVVAGMVVVVAAITIKKNWTSIKKRFVSNPNSRTPNDNVGGTANGTTPEEVPLQDKSPV